MSKSRKRMELVIALLCYSFTVAGVFYFLGYRVAYRPMENSTSTLATQTFYATISDIQNNTFTVTGMEVNDINFRGRFRFSIAERTKITWGIPIFQQMIWMLAIIFSLLLQEKFLKQIPYKYNSSRLFNYWRMKNKFQLICKNS